MAEVERILRAHHGIELGSMPVRFLGAGATSMDVEVFAISKRRIMRTTFVSSRNYSCL